tara:strand:+ start:915 stop:1346 length:432 start_codon:yes stop_codon:yes gene_type:complete
MNWRNGKAGFVGGLKYLIKGFFSYQHSVTSAAPVDPSEDCYTAFSGIITDEITAGEGLITDDFAENGLITDTLAINGLISEVIQWTSAVSVSQATLVTGIITLSASGGPVGNSVNGLIGTTTTAVNGLIDDSGIALNSKLCCC